MADAKKLLGGLGKMGKRIMSDGEEAGLTAAQRAEAGRKAAALIKSQPQVKASEALGQQMEKGFKRTTTTQADRTRVGGGNIGGAPFSAISEADPNYAGKVWGVMDEGTAARLKNLTDPETAWTTMLGSANQLKTNPIVFDKLKRQFIDSMKQGNLSPELEAKINHNLALTFGEGAQIRDPKIWRQADTFEKRAALADLMMGQGITPKKGGVALGGEKSGKGVIFRPTDTLKRETEPSLLHTEHGGDTPTFAAGPRLFTLEKESVYRPDLHPGFPTLLTGKDLEVNMIPTPTEVYLPEWHKQFKKRNPNRKPGYYDLALGVKGEGLPSQDLNDEYIRHLLREGFKDGGGVNIDEADKRLAKAIENRMAKGGAVDLEAADARLSAAIDARMADGGKVVKGAAKVFKRIFSDDVLPAPQREVNLKKFIAPSAEKRRMYHGSKEPNIKEFKTRKEMTDESMMTGHYADERDAVFLSPEPDFTKNFSQMGYTDTNQAPTTYPVYVQVEKPFDFDNPEHLKQVKETYKDMFHNPDSDFYERHISPSERSMTLHTFNKRVDSLPSDENNWARIENQDFQDVLKDLGFDSFYTRERGTKNLGVYEPNRIKSAIGNRGTYDLGESDINKADGGKIVKGLGKISKRLLSQTDEPSYNEISGMVSKLGEEGRLPIIPVPNRWFMQPDKFPNQQKLIERVLQQTGKSREDFTSGAFIDPRTGEILDSRIMDDLGVVIDPKTNRPMMSAKGQSGLEQLDPKTGAYTKSNLVRKGLFKPEGGDPLLNDLNFLATIEKGDVGHKYGLATEYASPAELFNTGTGANPTLRPRSRGDLFGIGDVVGKVRVGRSEPHEVYEKLFVAPKGSDVQGKKLSKASGGLAMADGGVLHMADAGKVVKGVGKMFKRMMADPDATTPAISSGTRKFGDDSGGLNIIKETGGNWSPSGDLVYQSNLDRELDKLKKGRFDTTSKTIKHAMAQDEAVGNTARKAQMEQALIEAQKREAANNWVDSNLRNYVTKQMATEDDPVRKLAEQNIKAFPVNIDEYGDAELRNYGSHQAKVNRQVTGYVPEGVAKSPLAKHYETMTDEAITPTPAKHFQRVQALPPMQRQPGTLDAPWVNKLDPETPIFSLNRDADFNKLGFDHIMDVLREDVAAGRIRPEQMNKISMEQAVRRTHEYDEALKEKMLTARIAEQANANVFKEYPEGYKWVQLDKPGQFSLESDIMGHSVRGYEPPQGHPDWADMSGNSGYKDYGHGGYEAIKSGDAKIYSLRDPRGMSHVTVEVAEHKNPYGANGSGFADLPSKTRAEYENVIRQWRRNNPEVEYLTDADINKALKEAGVQPINPPEITQIKGKQNAAPNEDYLEFVQDFVKSGNWSDVGDISNTGLMDVKYMTNPETYKKYLEQGLSVPKYATEKELEVLHNEYLRLAEPRNYKPPAEGMAEGGGAFKKLSFYGGGGITTSGGSFSAEELGVDPSDLVPSEKLSRKIKRGIAKEMEIGKEQLEQEYKQAKSLSGAKDLALRTGAAYLGGIPDLVNLGLMIPDAVAGTELASEKPWFGSQQYIDAMHKTGMLGENEFPLAELAAGILAPAGMIKKGAKKIRSIFKKEEPKKRRGGLAAMAR
jgi:hypothetical protein